jgi:nicotinate-nucleotide adenylyltransferase
LAHREIRVKTLCFGGSFNPIHHGHLISARAAAEGAGYDHIVLVPSSQPPHKPGDVTLAAPEHRLAMTKLAVAGDPLFSVDDLELRRSGPSYTIDTVREFKRRAGKGRQQVDWLIGADMLLSLPSWHESMQLLREVHFVVVARPGWVFQWNALPQEYRKLQENVVEAPLIEISGSVLRSRVAAGRSISYFTPPAVCRYVRDHRLYQTPASPAS